MYIIYKLGYMGKSDFGFEKEDKWAFRQSRADEMGINISIVGRAATEEEALNKIKCLPVIDK